MLKNYLKIALRNMWKNKAYALINIVGLALGLVCGIVILLYVHDELRFDKFHHKADRIFRVVERRHTPEQGESHFAAAMGPFAPALRKDFPEVENYVRLVSRWSTGRFTVWHGAARFYEGDHLFAESSFFEVFDFELLQGEAATALAEPKAVVLTENSAHKYFGAANPLDQVLSVERFGDFKVTGVLKNPPPNSHLDFSMLFSFATLEASPGWKRYGDTWTSEGFITYVLLHDPQAASRLDAKLADFNSKYRGAEIAANSKFYLQPLTDVHFGSEHLAFDRNQSKGDLTYIYLFSALACFIVLIACINYMNLATARSVNRAREVGMRKVMGAGRRQLAGQFWGEAILFALLAFFLALVVVELLLPSFNQFTGKQLMLELERGNVILFALLAMTLLVGVIAGSYPALYLSRLRPLTALTVSRQGRTSTSVFRRALVVAQFALSVLMIVATVVAYYQMQYLRTKRLGFNQEQLLVVDINSGNTRRNFRTIKTEMLRSPHVAGVSVSSRVPGDWKNLAEANVIPEGAHESQKQTVSFINADADFLRVFEIALAAGRNFSEEFLSDSAAVLINETAARAFGWEEAVGKTIRVPEENFSGRVIGVVKDFHFRSLHEKIAPLVLGYWNNPVDNIDYFTARLRTAELPATLQYLESVHGKFDQVTPFEYNFLDDRLQDFYQTDLRVSKLFGVSASLAIFIACLGLLGLAAFTAEQRTKEIGIRKVLGSSVGQIVLLLSQEFLRLVLVANLLAWPVAYFVLQRLLQVYAYRIDLAWWMFALVGLATCIIAVLTVSTQALKAAHANPVMALRQE